MHEMDDLEAQSSSLSRLTKSKDIFMIADELNQLGMGIVP
jgi:hypothetical protein